MVKLLVALSISSSAHAGWIANLCEGWLVADDPYQYEEVGEEWLVRELQRLEIRAAWGRADDSELRHRQIIASELQRRKERGE